MAVMGAPVVIHEIAVVAGVVADEFAVSAGFGADGSSVVEGVVGVVAGEALEV